MRVMGIDQISRLSAQIEPKNFGRLRFEIDENEVCSDEWQKAVVEGIQGAAKPCLVVTTRHEKTQLLGELYPPSIVRSEEETATTAAQRLSADESKDTLFAAAVLGAPTNRDANNRNSPPFEYCRSITLLSAVAGETQPIDSIYIDFNDDEGLREECQFAAAMGFTGKLTIHLRQIDIVNRAFSASTEAVEEARRLIAAFDEAKDDGRMAFSFGSPQKRELISSFFYALALSSSLRSTSFANAK